MTLKTFIYDGTGDGYKAKVTDGNALLVTNVDSGADELNQRNIRQFYSSTIDTMNVNGSVTPQEFYLNAVETYDIIISSIIIAVIDGTVSHQKFGAIAALTNGWDLIVEESGTEVPLISAAKTGGELILKSGMFAPFGNQNTAFELGWTGNNAAQVTRMDLSNFFPQNGGWRLGRGTSDRIISRVNDDLSTLVDFQLYFFGNKHLPS